MTRVWTLLRGVPFVLWAALAAVASLLWMYLRGRRLDAELALANLQKVSALSRVATARGVAKAEAHMERARTIDQKIDRIRVAQKIAKSVSEAEEKRLYRLPSSQVHTEYMQMIQQRKPEHRKEVQVAKEDK